MATRVNTKFVLILTAALFAACSIFGGLWILQRRGDTSRYIKAGDELMARQEYELALKEYGRAVGREPEELSHLHKYEQALLKIRPQTQDLARELFDRRIAVFSHEVRYRPRDAEAHLRFLREVHRTARFVNLAVWWQSLNDAADEMWKRLAVDDPKRIYARLYRGMANMRMTSVLSEVELTQAELDLAAFVEKIVEAPDLFPPEDRDLGWAALVAGRIALADKLRVDGETRRAQEKLEQAQETWKQAFDDTPNGPEIARVGALQLAVRRLRDEPVDADELTEAIDRMVRLVSATEDPQLLKDAVAILQTVGGDDGLSRALNMLEKYLQDHPQDHYLRWMQASAFVRNNDLNEAYEAANIVIEAEPVAVSLLSRMQQGLRRQSASLIVDIEYLRWEQADDADKDAQLQRTVAARDRLASLLAEPEKEPLLWRAEGKIALANEEYDIAASKFEAILKQMATPDLAILRLAAYSLEHLGQVGLAEERLSAAVAQWPRNPVLLAEQARLQYRLGRYDDAAETANRALALNPELELAQALVKSISQQQGGEQVEATDVEGVALAEAKAAFDEGDLDTARTTLVNALEQSPQNPQLLGRLVRIELLAGETDSARGYLDRALALQPENRALHRIQAALDNEDPIEAIKQYAQDIYDDEAEASIITLISLRALARQLDAAAQTQADSGDEEAATSTRTRAARARDEAQTFLARAQGLAPDDPTLLKHLFTEAIAVEDWDTAQELVRRAQASNADMADGLVFKGRLELAQENFEQAARTLTDATLRKHYSSAAWRLLGTAHERLGNFSEARRAYEESYRCNPNDPLAVVGFVRLLVQTGDKTRALLLLRTARHTMGSIAVLHDAWLRLEAGVGDLALAIRERRALYERSPADRANAMSLAALLGQARPTYQHIVDEQGMPIYDGERWGLLAEEDRRQLLEAVATEWVEESERILDALEAEGDDSLELAILRAQLLRSRGKADAGEQRLRDFIDQSPEADRTVEMFIALGQYQAGVNRLEEAISTFKTAAEYQSPDRREADRTLGVLYFLNGRFEQGVELYEQLAESVPEEGVQLQLVQGYTQLKRFDLARQRLEQVVQASGPQFLTAMLFATIAQGESEELYAQGDLAQAESKLAEEREALARAQRLEPSNSLPHIRLAQSLLREFGRTRKMSLLDDALLALGRADAAQAGDVSTSLVRVDILLAKDDRRGAIGELTRLLERWPDHVRARQLLVDLHLTQGNSDKAMEVVDAAIGQLQTFSPSYAMWYELKGDLYVRQGDIISAITAYEEAFRLEPTARRLAKVGETALTHETPSYSGVVTLLESAQPSFEGEPILRTVYARALDGADKRDEGLEQMRIAYRELRAQSEQGQSSVAGMTVWRRALSLLFEDEKPAVGEQFFREVAGDPLDAFELQWVATKWGLSGSEGISRAIELQRLAIDRCPTDQQQFRTRLLFDLGQYVLVTGDYREAAELFEQVIAVDADHAVALNNAAYIYVEELDEPAKALPHAQHAAELAPADASILDTLGWIHFKLGNDDPAEDFLRRSVELKPSVDSCLHLAYVLMRKGQPSTAEIYLRRAAELGPDADRQDEIDRLADEIKTKVQD